MDEGPKCKTGHYKTLRGDTAVSQNLFASTEKFLHVTWVQQWTPRRTFNAQSSSQ